MPPRNPQSGHPMADAAALEQANVDGMTNPAAATPAPEAPANPPPPASASDVDPAPEPVSYQPNVDPAPPATDLPPIDPDSVARLLQQNDTLLGRLDAETRARREAEERAAVAAQNREFTEKRLKELSELAHSQASEIGKMRTEQDVAVAVSGFKSEHVDGDTFGEIYRGLHPHLQRMQQSLEARVGEEVEKRLKSEREESAKREAELRKDLNERAIQRDVPEFGRLLDHPTFRDYLAETVPGSRSTRRNEVLAAWRDGDTKFIGEVVAGFKLRGAPRSVDEPPGNIGRTITDQTPRQPSPQPRISEDDMQASFQHMQEGKITVEEYRKRKALIDKQQLEDWRRSKRTN